MIHNYETNKGHDVEDVEEDKEHPREKEREKRL